MINANECHIEYNLIQQIANVISRIDEYSENKAITYIIIQEIINYTHHLISTHKPFIIHAY
jgi:hypothetical protein